MLSIEQLNKIAKEHGVSVEESTSGEHYILDKNGNKKVLKVDELFPIINNKITKTNFK